MRPLYTLASLLTAAASACGQDLLPKGSPEAEPIVLTNAVLHTVSDGIVLNGTLWFHNGKIRGVLPGDSTPDLPAGSKPRVIDLEGRHVYPGLISAHTSIGLQEIGMVRQTVDVDELGDITPEAIAAVAINPDSTVIPVARSGGVLAACVFPQRGLIPGRASIIQLDGWTNADLAVRADAGPVVSWPTRTASNRPRRRGPLDRDNTDPAERARKQRQNIVDAFQDARAWLDAYTADPGIAVDIRHLALAPALRGEVPVFVLANELEQIESAVLWATENRLQPVIVGGRDAALCAGLLREREVPVIVDGTHNLPRRDDSAYDEAFTLPARLAKLGVRFCLATGEDFSNDRNLPFHAATAAAFGLQPDHALAAITRDAADILGVGDRLGSLAVGKDATLFVSTGSPFEMTTRIERAFIAGREVDLRNKQTELAKKYRARYRQMHGK